MKDTFHKMASIRSYNKKKGVGLILEMQKGKGKYTSSLTTVQNLNNVIVLLKYKSS